MSLNFLSCLVSFLCALCPVPCAFTHLSINPKNIIPIVRDKQLLILQHFLTQEPRSCFFQHSHLCITLNM